MLHLKTIDFFINPVEDLKLRRCSICDKKRIHFPFEIKSINGDVLCFECSKKYLTHMSEILESYYSSVKVINGDFEQSDGTQILFRLALDKARMEESDEHSSDFLNGLNFIIQQYDLKCIYYYSPVFDNGKFNILIANDNNISTKELQEKILGHFSLYAGNYPLLALVYLDRVFAKADDDVEICDPATVGNTRVNYRD